MSTQIRILLAAFVLLLALPVSAQLDQVATTGGTTVERPRATATKPANRNTGTRATATRPANRATDRTTTRTTTNNRTTDPNYCPPQGSSSNRASNTNARRTTNSRASSNSRFGTTTQVNNRATATTQQRTQDGVSNSILFGKKGEDVGRAKRNRRN